MGREATCHLHWGQDSAACKVLLEASELIVRGPIKRRVPISQLQGISIHGNDLLFCVGQESVALSLGSELAMKWAKAIATPPPSLAKKLGITTSSKLLVIGEVADEELASAIALAKSTKGSHFDLIMVSVASRDGLEKAIRKLDGTPTWIVYPKGAGQQISEAMVRESLRAMGYMDTKVVSVSAKSTALRFQRANLRPVTASEDQRELRDLSGVGHSVEADLKSLGIATVAQLATRDGLTLYNQLCEKSGTRQDPCVLDVFRCAVAQAADPTLDSVQKNWWWWSRERKAGRV